MADEFLRAVQGGRAPDVESALEKNAANLKDAVDGSKCGALHFAAARNDVVMLQLLLKYSPNVDLVNADGVSPLMLAARGGHLGAIEALAAAGADARQATSGGQTAAHHAAVTGQLKVLQLLAKIGVDISVVGVKPAVENGTVLHWACEGGHLEVIEYCLYGPHPVPVDAPDAIGNTALCRAVAMKRPGLVTLLLEQGAKTSVKAAGNATPLHVAAAGGNLDHVKALLAFGADPQAKNANGATPLSLAEVSPANVDVVRELTRKSNASTAEATRLKNKGNEVFAKGENVKAAKFYSLAISMNPVDHVFFSNRSACQFNLRRFNEALLDGRRCVALSGGKWVKGFFRVAACLAALERHEEALATVDAGLALDTQFNDLLQLRTELTQKLQGRK